MSRAENTVSMARFKGHVVETGQSVQVEVPRRRKRVRGQRERVALLDLNNMARLELSGLEHRILIAIMSAVPEKGGTVAFITGTEIAEKVGSTQPAVSRALRSLRERRVILKPDARVGRYQVNAHLMYNGDFESWAAEADVTPEPIWTKNVDLSTGEVQ